MNAQTVIPIAAVLLTSACFRRSEAEPRVVQIREHATIMQVDADLMAGAHMNLYDMLASDDSKQSAQAHLLLLVLLDGYQAKKALLEAPPFNYTYPPTSRATAVAAFLTSHEAERKKFTQAIEAERAQTSHDDAPRRIRIIPQ